MLRSRAACGQGAGGGRDPACRRGALLCLPLLVALASASCSAAEHERRADRAANRVLREGALRGVAERRESVRYPEPLAADGAETDAPADARSDVRAEPRELLLDLASALEIAVQTNRDYLTRKESLFLTALSLVGTRHSFSPLVTSTLGYVFADGRGIPTTHDGSAAATLSQILPWGGNVTITGSTAISDTDAGTPSPSTWNSDLSVSLRQPLLRGAGREVTFEPLVQAERDLVYAVRDFELFREDFSIDVARQFYGLVQQKQSNANQAQNLESNRFSRQQAEALYRVGRTSSLDVLRARRSELTSENQLLAEQERYLLALDRFRIFLGLPDTVRVRIDAVPPEYVRLEYEMRSAIDVALENRLDYLNRREQLEDAERAVRIARNGLLPDLSLDIGTGTSSSGATGFGSQSFDEDVTVGLTLGLPLDRVFERNAYRSTQIELVRERRRLEQFRDELVVEIESAFRELERRRSSLEIQEQLIEDQQRNVRIAQIRFQRGDIPNRDKVEAEDALLNARNELVQEQVNHELARLELLRNLGILFIDDKGMWNE